MVQALPHLVAEDIALGWAESGGPSTEYAIACRGGALLAYSALPVARVGDDGQRRAALGALAPATDCETFGYVADATVDRDGQSGEAMICLELAVVEFGNPAVGAALYVAPYRRRKKRFGRDVIEIGPFEQHAELQVGAMLGQLMHTWTSNSAADRLSALQLMRSVDIELHITSEATRHDVDALGGSAT